MTIRYDDIHLYAKPGQAASATIRQWLDANGIAYTNLDYTDPTESLAALSTWFWDGEEQVTFEDTPVLVFSKVLWEADDGSDSYRKTCFAVAVADLPDDFVTLATQVS
jgi:hypothetical protein